MRRECAREAVGMPGKVSYLKNKGSPLNRPREAVAMLDELSQEQRKCSGCYITAVMLADMPLACLKALVCSQ